MEHHDHSAAPEHEDGSFATGVDHKPDPPDEELEPNFARGIAQEVPPGEEHHGRFSEGAEDLPDTPEKNIEGRFSTGNQESPTSE